MSVLIIIAKYKEDISWVNMLHHSYMVYDKSKNIPNVGRESETYLRYIIENYDNLPDYVVFLQGNPFDHLKIGNIEFLNNEIDSIHDCKSMICLNYIANAGHNAITRTKESFQALFDTPLPKLFSFSPGAQFIVPKDCILHRPKSFYETIRNVMSDIDNKTISYANCLVCPWTIEQMWSYIFNKNIPHKEISYFDLL